MSSENNMDAGAEAMGTSQSPDLPEPKSPQEEAATQENASGTEDSKAEPMKIDGGMQDIKWKVSMRDFAHSYKLPSEDEDDEDDEDDDLEMGARPRYGEVSSANGTSVESVLKFIGKKTKLSEKVEELERMRLLKVQKLLNLVHEARVVTEQKRQRELMESQQSPQSQQSQQSQRSQQLLPPQRFKISRRQERRPRNPWE